MEVAKSLDKLSEKLDSLDNDSLLHLLNSLENMLMKTRDMVSTKSPSQPPPTPVHRVPPPPSPSSTVKPPPPPKLADSFRYQSNPLDDDLVSRVHQHIKGLNYYPNPRAPNSPDIFLYGNDPYVCNQQSSKVTPTPIISSLPMSELFLAVNRALNTNYNSMLINRYKNIHSCLDFHKDDEKSLDPNSSISALSLGATRRLLISPTEDKNNAVHTVKLEPRSLNTMLPGFQQKYYHSIAPGKKSQNNERGIRYSITFRCVIPNTSELPITIEDNVNDTVEDEETEKEEVIKEQNLDADKILSPNTVVFGSSLAKGLDATLLSRYEKKFKVFSNSGAKIKDIENDVKHVTEEGTFDTFEVLSVFLICGGNDIENLHNDSDIEDAFIDFENLVKVTRHAFSNAQINIISLIPRRARYKTHINNMHEMNEWLEDFCHKSSNLRFVNIFTHFLYRLPHIWYLNTKLFNGRKLHFNKVGNSVLAKVLIGVSNSPR